MPNDEEEFPESSVIHFATDEDAKNMLTYVQYWTARIDVLEEENASYKRAIENIKDYVKYA